MSTEIKIEEAVPIPSRSKWSDLLGKMKAGDSVVVSRGESIAMNAQARFNQIRITTRQIEPNKVRVWKL